MHTITVRAMETARIAAEMLDDDTAQQAATLDAKTVTGSVPAKN